MQALDSFGAKRKYCHDGLLGFELTRQWCRSFKFLVQPVTWMLLHVQIIGTENPFLKS